LQYVIEPSELFVVSVGSETGTILEVQLSVAVAVPKLSTSGHKIVASGAHEITGASVSAVQVNVCVHVDALLHASVAV
jgi:hypothetical protein